MFVFGYLDFHVYIDCTSCAGVGICAEELGLRIENLRRVKVGLD